MPTIIVHHDIDDTQHWLASPRRAALLEPLGIKSIRTFTNPASPTQVALMMDVPDLDALVCALGTEEAADAMREDTVHPDTLVLLVEA